MKNIFTFLIILFSLYYIFQQDSTTKSQRVSKVKIVGLNDYNFDDLKLVESTLESFYKIDCDISKSIKTQNNSIIDCEETQRNLGNIDYFSYDDNESIVIYTTNSKLKSLNKGVWGVCYGNSIYLRSDCMFNKEDSKQTLRETAIHEFAHIYIYSHCHNECIMNYESLEKWNEVSDKPIFCKDCKSKLP